MDLIEIQGDLQDSKPDEIPGKGAYYELASHSGGVAPLLV